MSLAGPIKDNFAWQLAIIILKKQMSFKLTIPKDFANYEDEALEIYPTIVYACTAVFYRHWLFWLFESLTIDIKTLVI